MFLWGLKIEKDARERKMQSTKRKCNGKNGEKKNEFFCWWVAPQARFFLVEKILSLDRSKFGPFSFFFKIF